MVCREIFIVQKVCHSSKKVEKHWFKRRWSPIAEAQVWVGLGVEDLQARDGRLRFKMELAFLTDFGTCWFIQNMIRHI